ncbi:hypothetical protein [Jejuia spongiicola]|uniref:Uncharacterized protein n=1 Tax=Jejuia spongiicola TaxID=2942207 RepID=A0ABT0QCT9_9FLAO|nr:MULTISPECIES: hypothetical protein [Flavobacteriaceae]MCL6294756.1 hypothetical protein [Jejuia spongiicola]PIA81378.1 hypothetical protein BFR04_14540 [Gaetbulibacter sp. 4G1]
MKTNIYILLILLLSFSFANAQDNVVKVETENTVSVSDNNEDVIVTVDSVTNTVNKKEAKADKVEVKENVARTNSDIRIYLNRVRKVENIKWLFPKMNKAKVA